MSLRNLDIYTEVIFIERKYNPLNEFEASHLKKYRDLYMDYSYLKLKIEMLKEFANETQEALTMRGNDKTWRQFYEYRAEKAKNELNKEIEELKKLESELDKLIYSSPIRDIRQKNEEEYEKKYGKYGEDWI